MLSTSIPEFLRASFSIRLPQQSLYYNVFFLRISQNHKVSLLNRSEIFYILPCIALMSFQTFKFLIRVFHEATTARLLKCVLRVDPAFFPRVSVTDFLLSKLTN